jgi:hypothetical protein
MMSSTFSPPTEIRTRFLVTPASRGGIVATVYVCHATAAKFAVCLSN